VYKIIHILRSADLFTFLVLKESVTSKLLFMAGIAVSEGVVKTILVAGNGADVKKGNTITVHCTGILAANNKKFWRFDIRQLRTERLGTLSLQSHFCSPSGC